MVLVGVKWAHLEVENYIYICGLIQPEFHG